MRKLIVLLILALVVFAIWNRNRLFVRDPLGTVTRDGVKESGAQVFENYSNDVLIENDNAPSYLFLVQHGQAVGVPQKIACIHWLACLTNADEASLLPLGGPAKVMTNRVVAWNGGDGHAWRVTLR